jgi:WhiB family transcriptional regulator, redox-sensing transcriptional regulator
MTISVLDRTGGTTDASLGGLHDAAGAVDHELLPCRINDPELWFGETPADVEFAKTLCLDCPVRSLCLDGALERREPWGVWGGQLFLQGAVIPRKRTRGRPLQNEGAAWVVVSHREESSDTSDEPRTEREQEDVSHE